MQTHDLKVSGKIVLAAAILLKVKSTHLIENDISRLDALMNETDEDMEDDMSDKDSQIKELQESINKAETWSLSKRIAELTAEMDWKDWLPKFDIKELLEFSKEKNFLPKDPIELYNFKYQAEIYAKKYEKAGTEVDKGNKGNFEPTKRNPTFANGDEDFEASAKEILDSIGQTT